MGYFFLMNSEYQTPHPDPQVSRDVRLYFLKKYYIFLSRYLFTFTNRVDPDEMQHYTAFHLGLHWLQKYSFRGFANTKG